MAQETTESIIHHCKNSGFSVTAFAYAAPCHAVCDANFPSSWPVTFSAPLQPINRAGKLDLALGSIQCAMSTIPVTWTLEQGMSVQSTAFLIHNELRLAMSTCISPMDSYISVMLDAFKAQLISDSAGYAAPKVRR